VTLLEGFIAVFRKFRTVATHRPKLHKQQITRCWSK